MVQYCIKCKKECYHWESTCSDCIHKMTMIAINNLDNYLSKTLTGYAEMKHSLEGELI